MSELENHHISRIEAGQLESRYPRTVGKNARLGSHGSGMTSPMAVVHTDQGAMGWGLLRGDADLSQLIGRRVTDLFDPATGVLVDEALPLDFALHDLAGVILGKPVYAMLAEAVGRTPDRAVPCYDGA